MSAIGTNAVTVAVVSDVSDGYRALVRNVCPSFYAELEFFRLFTLRTADPFEAVCVFSDDLPPRVLLFSLGRLGAEQDPGSPKSARGRGHERSC